MRRIRRLSSVAVRQYSSLLRPPTALARHPPGTAFYSGTVPYLTLTPFDSQAEYVAAFFLAALPDSFTVFAFAPFVRFLQKRRRLDVGAIDAERGVRPAVVVADAEHGHDRRARAHVVAEQREVVLLRHERVGAVRHREVGHDVRARVGRAFGQAGDDGRRERLLSP